MRLVRALRDLGVTRYAFQGDDPVDEAAFMAGFRAIVDGVAIDAVPPVAWAEVERAMVAHTLAEARRWVEDRHAALLAQLTGNASLEERDSWKIKQEAAAALLDGRASPIQTDMLAMEAAGRGLSVDALATLIMTKSDAFCVFVGAAGAVRGRALARLDGLAATVMGLAQTDTELAAVRAAFDQEAAAIPP